MDIVKVKIEKSKNILTYVKMIHSFNKNLSLGEIKRRIEKNEDVIVFDLDDYDFLDEFNGISEYDYEISLYNLLLDLKNQGAELKISLNDDIESLELLYNWINTRNEINKECDRIPD